MTFDEVLAQIQALLQREQRVSYRGLKRRFALDDEYLEDLKDELIKAKRLAVDEDGEVLVWVGKTHGAGSKEHGAEGDTGDWRKGEKEGAPGQWTPPHLAERIRAATVTDGERKTITALFADLKGSTALIEGLDPEEARALVDPALQLMMDAVHRYEGYVAQVLGDGIFALFGAPLAHEDHPQRALYAALRMQEEMRRYGDQIRLRHGVPLAMRVGINTGEVVLRSIRKEDLHTDYVPVGHSTNLAARMEQMATPGSILVTAYTYKLAEGYFTFKALGQTQIKGVEEPLNIYEVLGAGPLRTRLQVTATRRGLTRFVGRQREMEQLQHALTQATAGHGQIVGVMGEPGLGKSRLFYEFKLLSPAGCLILEAYSVSHGKASPYLPVIELLKHYFRIEATDDERTRREKIAGKVVMLDRSLDTTLPYLFALLGIEEQPSPLQQMDPPIRRRRTFAALKTLFLRESLRQPLILIFEDLHWIDSETQGFLDTLSEGVASAQILLFVNYRPEYRHEWGQKTYYTQLRLAPFGRAEAEEFLTFLLGHDTGLAALKQQILAKTEGTPFFMEEVVQTLEEDGTLTGNPGHYALFHPVATLQLPTTVQGVLAARIDRLAPEEKALLQQLAVIGREFSLGLIRQVIGHSEDELYRLLSSLQHKEFLYEQPAFPEVEYLFKHALTQEVAYNSVLMERRKALHEQTGQAIERLYHDQLEEHYDELAHHYQRSGNTEKAIEYLHKAGQRAVQRSANADAIRYLTTALELLMTLPATPPRIRHEVTLQVALGAALTASRGYAVPEVETAYARARQLCLQVDDTAQLAPILSGLWTVAHMSAALATACVLGEELLTLAQRVRDPILLMQAHRARGASLGFRGELLVARTHLEHAVATVPGQATATVAHSYVHPSVGSRAHLALVLWVLGYPEQARRRCQEALARARDLQHPGTLTMALSLAAWIHELGREWELVREYAEAIVQLATEHALPNDVALGTVLRGEALVAHGHTEEGIACLREGWTALRAVRKRLYQPYSFGLCAEALGRAGQVENGREFIRQAFTVLKDSEERWCEAELYRIRGALLLAQEKSQQRTGKEKRSTGSLEQAGEGSLLQAIAIAQQQHAKSWELRATVSLAKLWQQQGKQQEAHAMLSAIYGWFTEGFDTKDLQEAKALLEDLRAS